MQAWDHPHACGDKIDDATYLMVNEGSSPRVWGQEDAVHSNTVQAGIIPTRVGTSSAVNREVNGHRDHPHACGDKKQKESSVAISLGSSPRVWGQVNVTSSKRTRSRIIPTRVGTSPVAPVPVMNSQDHPHACGDKSL